MAVNKPSNLSNKMWASAGTVEMPSDAKIASGWTVEVPKFQTENWVQGRNDQAIGHINERGIAEWDATTDYTAGKSYVQGSDGKVYLAKVNSGPSSSVQNPVTDTSKTKWDEAFAGKNGVVFKTGENGAAILPTGTTAQRPTPSEGLLRLNSDTGQIEGYQAGRWGDINITSKELFSGDNLADEFQLSSSPASKDLLQVYISGVYQQKNTYEIGGPAGDLLIFDEAPPSGVNNIEVVVSSLSSLNPSDDLLRTELASTAGAGGSTKIGRGVAALDSIAALLSLPEDQRRSDLRYLVASYFDGWAVEVPFVGPQGGGSFVWVADLSKSEHDGGQVIDPTKVYANTADWYTGTNTGDGCFVRTDKAAAAAYGAKGDGVTDDVHAFRALLAAGGDAKLAHQRTYRLQSGLDAQNVTLDLNGSTLDFVTSGNVYPLRLLSNSGVRNGRISSTGGTWGAIGSLGSPISVGEYIGGAQHSNISISNVSIYSQQRACIYILGDTFGVDVRNITIEDSPTMIGAAIVAHWGRDLAEPTFAKLYHPHNITIENVEVGSIPNAEHCLFLSSNYNVSVKNVRIKETGGAALGVFIGDFGFRQNAEPATAPESIHGMSGITADNIVCYKSETGVQVANRDAGIDPFEAATWPSRVIIRNSVFYGLNLSSATSNYAVVPGSNTLFENCVFRNFYTAVFAYRQFSDTKFSMCTFQNMFAGALVTGQDFGADSYEDLIFEDCEISTCNRLAAAGFRVFSIKYAKNFTLRRCLIDIADSVSALLAHASWPSSGIVIDDCEVTNCSAGKAAFVLGTGAVTGFAKIVRDNRLGAGAGGDLYGGQLLSPHVTSAWGGKVMGGQAAPTIGTWSVGDMVVNRTPSAGAPSGWMCVTAGSPGTWKAMANLAA